MWWTNHKPVTSSPPGKEPLLTGQLSICNFQSKNMIPNNTTNNLSEGRRGPLFFLLLLILFITNASALSTLPSPHRYMPHSFLKVDTSLADLWRPQVTDAAQHVVDHVNSIRPADEKVKLDSVEVLQTKVGSTVAFSGIVDTVGLLGEQPALPSDATDSRVYRSSFSYLNPPQELLTPLWTLPSSSASSSSSLMIQAAPTPHGATSSLQLPELEMEGPLVLHLDKLLYDPTLRLPRHVDAGPVHSIHVAAGVRLHMAGISEIHLWSPLTRDNSWKILESEKDEAGHRHEKRSSTSSSSPLHLGLKLLGDGRGFHIWSTNNERIKVKRRAGNVVELTQPTTTTAASNNTNTQVASLDSSGQEAQSQSTWVLSRSNLIREVLQAFQKVTQRSGGERQPSVELRGIIEGKAETVIVMAILVHLQESDGGVTEWEAIVTRGADGKMKVVSLSPLTVAQPSTISIAPSVLANTTWPAIMSSVRALGLSEDKLQAEQ